MKKISMGMAYIKYGYKCKDIRFLAEKVKF